MVRLVTAALSLGALLAASCSSSTPDVAPTSHAASSTSTTTTSGRASAALTFTGDADVDGVANNAEVTCSFPDVDGRVISVFAPARGAGVSYRIRVAADKVSINIDSGAGDAFRERNFEGPGVSAFDFAHGAQIDAQLTEAAPTPGVDAGEIGTLSAVRGSIDCGQQTPGSSTITVTGDTATASYRGARPQPVVVECYAGSGELTVIGVARAGNRRALFLVSLGVDGSLNAEEMPAHATPRYYESAPGAATLSSRGGEAKGTVVEKHTPAPHTLHLEGRATCGTPIRD